MFCTLTAAADGSAELLSLKNALENIPLQKILIAIVVLAACLLAVHLLLKLTDRLLLHSKLDKSLHRFIHSIVRILLYFLVILLICGTLGIDVTSLIALLSVVSLAVSLAVQDLLTNVAGGAMLMNTKPFKQGDWVEADGVQGTVDEIGMVYTRIVTADHCRVNFPNSKLASAVVRNYSAMGKRRLDTVFHASYDSDPELVKQALAEAADFPLVLPDTPIIRVREYADSDIAYQVSIWVTPENYVEAGFCLNERVWDSFRKRDIEMTYPHLNVHVEQAK